MPTWSHGVTCHPAEQLNLASVFLLYSQWDRRTDRQLRRPRLVVWWLSVRSEMQTCIWPSWYQCHSLSLASVKSRLVLPFWYRLTRVVPETGPLNGCVCVCVRFSFFSTDLRDWLGRHLRNDLFCVEWDVNLNSINQSQKPQKCTSQLCFYKSYINSGTDTEALPKNTEALAAQTKHKLLDQLHSSGIQPTSWLLYESH